jgi:hypothetical protein
MEQMLERQLAETNIKQEITDANLERLEAEIEAKVEANLRETKAEIRTSQEKMEAKIQASNEKFEVLRNLTTFLLTAMFSICGALSPLPYTPSCSCV